jgi:two-component sensor histidine kinase
MIGISYLNDFSMALIHEDPCRSQDLRCIDFRNHLRNLVSRLVGLYRVNRVISFVPAVESISLDIDKAIPCGLIVNELCTNALKCAFPEGFRGAAAALRVEFTRLDGERVRLIVRDPAP